MSAERIERSTHIFWKNTCGIDTYRRSPQHARHDTPWNAFSPDNVLVCTLWLDQIVDVHDPQEGRTRRFVKIGGKMKTWKGPAVAHGEEADRNLRRAALERLRVVGYEAEPNPGSLKNGDRKVAHFYLDRAHELKRVFELSGKEMLERLKVEEVFRRMHPQRGEELDPRYLFELVEPRGDFPGRSDSASTIAEAENEGMDDDDGIFDEAGEEASSTQEQALKAVRILVEHVLKQRDGTLRTLTYKQLAEQLNRRNKNGDAWARGLKHVLGKATSLLDLLKMEWGEPVPYLTTIVVSSQGPNKDLPGIGIKGKWPGYDQLTQSEKEAKLIAEYQRILEFGSRWNEVLVLLNVPLVTPKEQTPQSSSGAGKGGWGGGESEEHKALKRFVKDNPHLVGAAPSWFAVEEYALRSGDEIDVFFRSEHSWIGVEVKSAVSDGLDRDYERGLYQVVKYKAVLHAQAAIDNPQDPPSVQVFLVLEHELPKKYRTIASSLDVPVLEHVKSVHGKPLALESFFVLPVNQQSWQADAE